MISAFMVYKLHKSLKAEAGNFLGNSRKYFVQEAGLET